MPYPEDPNAVYYRPLRNKEGKVVVCHVQWFDEFDYDQSRFLTEVKFSTEEAALAWIENNVKEDRVVRCAQELVDWLHPWPYNDETKQLLHNLREALREREEKS